jgi:predicted transcriptional regulator
MATKLDLIMRLFSVSGKEIASVIHVDGSLVSRWRKGKRTLRFDSSYMAKIVNYFMELDVSVTMPSCGNFCLQIMGT